MNLRKETDERHLLETLTGAKEVSKLGYDSIVYRSLRVVVSTYFIGPELPVWGFVLAHIRAVWVIHRDRKYVEKRTNEALILYHTGLHSLFYNC